MILNCVESLPYSTLSFARALHYIKKYIAASLLQEKYIISSATHSKICLCNLLIWIYNVESQNH